MIGGLCYVGNPSLLTLDDDCLLTLGQPEAVRRLSIQVSELVSAFIHAFP